MTQAYKDDNDDDVKMIVMRMMVMKMIVMRMMMMKMITSWFALPG